MAMRFSTALQSLCWALFSIPFAAGQDSVVFSTLTDPAKLADGRVTGILRIDTPGDGDWGVTGAPFSGEIFSNNVLTGADGTRVPHTNPPIKIFRDSKGRVRTES